MENNNNERQMRDDNPLLLLLASGMSIRRAADKSGFSSATISRKLADNEFQARLNKLRSTILDRAVSRLIAISIQAVNTLHKLLTSDKDSIKLQAAKTVLENLLKANEAIVVNQRLNNFEELLQRNANDKNRD